jgi:hypothetical protein
VDWAELKRRRAAAIKEMQFVLDHTEPLGLNVVVVFLMGIPVLLWQLIKGSLGLVVGTLMSMVWLTARAIAAPFITLYLIVDLTLIGLWYLKEVSIKTSEDK